MNFQLDIFTASQLRDTGMALAESHANEVVPEWSERAYQKLIEYLGVTEIDFMTETFRVWAEMKGLEKPPSGRAYGGIIAKAAKNKLIVRTGYSQTSNPTAHCTPAAVWKKIK